MIRLPRSREPGAVALMATLLCTLAALAALLVGVVVTDLALTAARAGTAADAAALAAVSGSVLAGGSGLPDVAAAARAARANGAQIVTVDADGWPLQITVEVVARQRSPLLQAVTDGLRVRRTATLRAPAAPDAPTAAAPRRRGPDG